MKGVDVNKEIQALADSAAEVADAARSFARAKIIAERVMDALFRDVEAEGDE